MDTAINPEIIQSPSGSYPPIFPQMDSSPPPDFSVEQGGGFASPSPLLRVQSNAQIEAERAEKARKLNIYQHIPPIMDLAAHVRKCWQAAKDSKIDIEEKIFEAQRQRNGEYDPADQVLLEASGGSEIYMMLTSVKCRAIEGGIKDVMLPSGEKCWSLAATPVPTMKQQVDKAVQDQLSFELQQMSPAMMAVMSQEALDKREFEIRQEIESELKNIATEVATSQEKYIQDSFEEGGHEEAMDAFIKDFTTFPTAFIKGPVIRNRKKLTYGDMGDGTIGPLVKKMLTREYVRVSPYDLYPSPGAKNLDDGYLLERMRLRVRELLACADVPGFKAEAVRAVCALYGNGNRNDWLWTDEERKRLENRPYEENDPEAIIEALEFNGYVQGYKLVEWGLGRDKIQNLEEEYACKLWMVDNYVIMARLNDHPLGHRGYYGASYEAINDSIWGKGPPQLMRDCAKACNGAARAILNNMGISSGPQVEVQVDRLDPDEDPEEIYPWKVWKTRSDQNTNNKQAVFFYQPKLVVKELLAIFDKFYAQAGEQVGVPAYEHGSTDTKGAGETARGLSMLMDASSKIIKDAIRNIDKHVTIPLVENTWVHLVMFDKIPLAGDIRIVARASEYMVMYDRLQMLRREWLQITNNPTDMAIIGFEGRAEVHREVIKSLKLPTEGIIPSKAEIQRMMMTAEKQDQRQSPEKKKEDRPKEQAKKPAEPAVSGTKAGAQQAGAIPMQ